MKEDKDIEEFFGEAMPEAAASTTIRAYYKGFSVLFTKRNMKGDLSVNGVQEFVDDLVKRGFNPSWNTPTEEPKPKEMKKEADPSWINERDVKTDQVTTPAQHCVEHNVKMDRYEKEGKHWFSHSKNDEKKVWCSGNGWKE